MNYETNYYLNKYGFTGTRLKSIPHKDTYLIVVIPCYDEDGIIASLNSLENCHATKHKVEVIVVFNASKKDDIKIHEKNIKFYNECLRWKSELDNSRINYEFIIDNNLPGKYAGVGLARKIGLDEAVYRLEMVGQKNAVLVCFDADTCCANNFLIEIEKVFFEDPKLNAISIHFEHPVEGSDFKQNIYDGIIQYELHLRYYNLAMKYTGFPFAHHTIGSAMAFRSMVYQKQGGMNKRKAGEDFYFLHKIIPLGNFKDLHTTEVYPSPRVSARVPFGTGRAQRNWINKNELELPTYSFQSFKDLKLFFNQVPRFYFCDKREMENELINSPTSVKEFLGDTFFYERIEEIKNNVSSYNAYVSRFYKWFDAFRILKFVHFCRDNYYKNITVSSATYKLLEALGEDGIAKNTKALLQILRALEKKDKKKAH